MNPMLQGSHCTALCGSCVWAGREASAGRHICEESGGRCGVGRAFCMTEHPTHLQPLQPLAPSVVHPNEDMHQGETALGPAGLAFWHWDQVPPTSHWHRLTMVTARWSDLLTPRQGAQTSNQGTTISSCCCSLPLLPEGLRCQQSCITSGERSTKGSCSPLLSFSYWVTMHKPTLCLGECLSSRRRSLLRAGRSPTKHTRKILSVCSAFLGLLQPLPGVMEE